MDARVCTPKIIGMPTCLLSVIGTSIVCEGVTTGHPLGRPFTSLLESYSVTAGLTTMRVFSVCIQEPASGLKLVNTLESNG